MRWECISCSGFFTIESDDRPKYCPYCKDQYFCDNILPDIPPPIMGDKTIHFECGHKIKADLTGDISCCPICGEAFDYQDNGEPVHIVYHQLDILEMAGAK